MEVVKDTQLSATQRLPDELILNVFNHLRKRRNWTELARLQSMVTVSQVCSRWRGIAIAASALWSELVISPSDTQNIESSKRARDRIEECLFRSRTHPLNIHFDLTRMGNGISPLGLFNGLALPNLWRCSNLDVAVQDHATASVIFPLRGDLSSMESLGIGIEDGIDEEDDRALEQPVMIRSFSDAIFSPSRFRITTRLPATIPGFDGSRLEALYIADEDIGYSTILKLLQSSMNVQRMHLELLDPGALVHESLDFPHLAFLSVIYDWPSRNFQLPALQKLFFIEPFLLNQSHTWANLQADFPKLRHLTFVNVVEHFSVPEVEEIFSVLGHLPLLVTLELKHWSMNWLLHFAIAGPLAPRAVDTEWLASHDPSLSMHIPPPGDRRRDELDVEVLGSRLILPELRLLAIYSSDAKTSAVQPQGDLGMALQRIMNARPRLSVRHDGSFLPWASGDMKEGEALFEESMDLGYVQFRPQRVDNRMYSGIYKDIIV